MQATGSDGRASFTSIIPGCYPGRMPHVHFEIYRSIDAASSASRRLKTSQLALPPEVCRVVYATAAGYADSASALERSSFDSDFVFRDGVTDQLASVSGNLAQGFAATLTVGIAA